MGRAVHFVVRPACEVCPIAMGDGTKYAAWIYPMYSSVIAHLDVGSQRGNQTEARAIGHVPLAEW